MSGPPRNLPNLITMARLVLAVCLFGVLWLVGGAQATPPEAGGLWGWARDYERLLLGTGTVMFLVAAISDFLDGYVARRWNLQTDFGRIFDPFADKVIVCGSFVLLLPLRGSPVAPWMVVVILARELLVDGLRGFAESRGVAFPSQWAGKVKMTLQSWAIGWSLLTMAAFRGQPWAEGFALFCVVLALIVTVYSGASYVWGARALLSGEELARHVQAPAQDAPAEKEEVRSGGSA
ncbi:MAG: CDP-diacylglycerol--glycerol-3-phosphate 3-phosphatidyltransferase [Planctomycetota bacterium]